MKSFRSTVAAAIMIVGSTSTVDAQQVTVSPNLPTLEERWAWAVEAEASGPVWIGYSIDRLMKESSWIGSFDSWTAVRETTLIERITGRHLEYAEDIQSAARRALSRAERREDTMMVMKEVAFLFRFDGRGIQPEHLTKVRMSNIDLAVDLGGLPLRWLGKHDTQSSLDHIERLFGDVRGEKQKKHLVAVLGIHGKHPRVFGILRDIIAGEDGMDVREDAVFWISQQNGTEALSYLLDLAERSGEREIMERAVFGVSQIDDEAAIDGLIRLGRTGTNERLREKAVFWLGQRASRKAVEGLKEFAYEDDSEKVQKQAIFALGQIDDGGGVEEMIRIANTHQNPKIRKHAIFWLGQSDDPRAFDAIVAIVKGR